MYRLTRALESKYTVVTGTSILPNQVRHQPARPRPPPLDFHQRREPLARRRPSAGHCRHDPCGVCGGDELLDPGARRPPSVIAEDLLLKAAPDFCVEEEHRLVLLRHRYMLFHITI